jgi:hypothetical protein
MNRQWDWSEWLSWISMAMFLAGRTAGHNISDLVFTAGPVDGRFRTQHTLYFSEMAMVYSGHYFLPK